MIKKTFLILVFFISSCGYQPIYLNKNLKIFEFQKILMVGDDNINNKIINVLSLKENDKGENQNRLFISSSSQILETSKDSKGQIKSFKTVVNVNLEIKNKNNEVIRSKNFFEEFNYDNRKNKYELVEYQNSTKNNLIEKIISDINIYLNVI